MDGSRILYDHIAYQIVLPLLGGVVAPVIGFFVYRFARRRFRLKDTVKSKAFLFYRVLSAVLLGQFLCHTIIHSDVDLGIRFMFIFVLVGYVLMDIGESIGRVWNTNSGYTGPLDEHVHDEVAMNREKMEENTVVVADNIASHDFSNLVWTMEDVAKDKRKREWMLGILLVIFAIITTMDGMMLIFRNPMTTEACIMTVACYYVNGISMSVAVYGAMIHAKTMYIEEDRPRILWSAGLVVLWSLILVASAIPVLVGAQVSTIATTVQSKAFLAFYGTASGCVLKLQQYFYGRKADTTDKRDTVLGLIVFVAAVGQSAVTGFIL